MSAPQCACVKHPAPCQNSRGYGVTGYNASTSYQVLYPGVVHMSYWLGNHLTRSCALSRVARRWVVPLSSCLPYFGLCLLGISSIQSVLTRTIPEFSLRSPTFSIGRVTLFIMDSFMLQDEAVRDRIRQAQDFLDPSTKHQYPLQT